MSKKKLLLARAINQAIRKGHDPSVVVPCGAKGKGKETYEINGKKGKGKPGEHCSSSAGPKFSKRYQDLAPKK